MPRRVCQRGRKGERPALARRRGNPFVVPSIQHSAHTCQTASVQLLSGVGLLGGENGTKPWTSRNRQHRVALTWLFFCAIIHKVWAVWFRSGTGFNTLANYLPSSRAIVYGKSGYQLRGNGRGPGNGAYGLRHRRKGRVCVVRGIVFADKQGVRGRSLELPAHLRSAFLLTQVAFSTNEEV